VENDSTRYFVSAGSGKLGVDFGDEVIAGDRSWALETGKMAGKDGGISGGM
jgi:hypothetical protein